MKKDLPKIIAIVGPTASGKTGLAVKLAEKFDGEIISADSRQIYKEMKIGTAKPSREERKRTVHHLVDFLNPDQKFNAALYKKMALGAIKRILKKNKVPFLVGGTGLYIRAIAENYLFPKIPAQKDLRKKLEGKTTRRLFNTYRRLDPKGALKIDKNNRRRLIRAIEVCKTKKEPFWETRKKGEKIFNILIMGIKLPKKILEGRIAERTEEMFNRGLEKEVKKLLEKYGSSPLLSTIGYAEWIPRLTQKTGSTRLTKGQKEEIKKEIKLHTIQFTKRQMTWFKKNREIKWIKNHQEAEKLVEDFMQK